MDNNNLEQNTMLIDDNLLHNFNSNNTVGKNNAKKISSLNKKLFFFNFITIIVSILFAIIFMLARIKLYHSVERAIERSFCIPIMWNVIFVVFSFILKGQNSTTRTARTIQIFSVIGSILTFLLLIYFRFLKLSIHIDYQISFIFGILFIICYIILFLIIQSEYKNFMINAPQAYTINATQGYTTRNDVCTQYQIEFEQPSVNVRTNGTWNDEIYNPLDNYKLPTCYFMSPNYKNSPNSQFYYQLLKIDFDPESRYATLYIRKTTKYKTVQSKAKDITKALFLFPTTLENLRENDSDEVRLLAFEIIGAIPFFRKNTDQLPSWYKQELYSYHYCKELEKLYIGYKDAINQLIYKTYPLRQTREINSHRLKETHQLLENSKSCLISLEQKYAKIEEDKLILFREARLKEIIEECNKARSFVNMYTKDEERFRNSVLSINDEISTFRTRVNEKYNEFLSKEQMLLEVIDKKIGELKPLSISAVSDELFNNQHFSEATKCDVNDISTQVGQNTVVTQNNILKKCETEFIHHKTFLNKWIIDSKHRRGLKRGLKYEDSSGCYVILIFNHEVTNGDYSDYRDVYVGQSKKIYNRVHNHFIGKGNGDVYCDVRNEMYVYVKFYKCCESEMNDLEKRLIALYDATTSYNKTHGGSGQK